MSIITLEENVLIAIEKDNIDGFISATTRFLDWEHHRIDKSTEYLVHNAIRHKATRILSYMLKTRIDINVKDEKSQTPLHFAIKFGLCEVVENIYTYYSKELVLVEDWNGNTELHKWVIFHSNCENCLKILSKLKTLKNKTEYFVKRNSRGNSALHLSIIYEMFNAFKLLISNKYFEIDITDLGENNNNLLHFACIYKNTDIFNHIIWLDVFNIDNKNVNLETPLNLALTNENFKFAEKLLDLDATVSLNDRRIAYEKNHKELFNRIKGILDMKSNTTKAKVQSKGRTPNSTNLRVKYFNPSPEKLYLDNRTVSNKELKQSQSKNNASLRMTTVGEMENLRLEMDNSFSSRSLIKTTSKPYIKVVKNLKRDLSNQSSKSKVPVESKNSSSINERKDNSKSKLTSSSKLNLYTSTSPGKSRTSKSPGRSRVFSTTNNIQKNISDKVNNAKKIILPKISIVNKESNNISIDSLLNFEMVKNFTTINYKDLTLEELIYSAEISNVYRGKYLHLSVAIKVYDIAKLKEEDIKYFSSEVNLLMSLRHPNIVTFIGTCVDSSMFYLVTEYMDKKSLKNVLEDKNDELSTYDKLKFCFDIALACNYLHTRKPQVFHRDLKSSNCLVDMGNRVKLCDFGLSKTYEEFYSRAKNYETNTVSTCYWMAPEFIIDNIFTHKADIYAYGILCWEIMMRDTIPYKNIPEVTFLVGDPEVLKMRPLIPDDFDSDIRALIEWCWHADYKTRPDFNTVIKELEILLLKYNAK